MPPDSNAHDTGSDVRRSRTNDGEADCADEPVGADAEEQRRPSPSPVRVSRCTRHTSARRGPGVSRPSELALGVRPQRATTG